MKHFLLTTTLYFLLIHAPAQVICLNDEEAKLYDLIMTYRKEKRLYPIQISSKLTQVAQLHAQDLANHFDVQNKDNCNPHSWSSNGNWASCCYTSDHAQAACMWEKPKEIAGYLSHGYEIAYFSSAGASAEEGLEGWKKSAGHNPLLINSGMWRQVEWKAIGIGFYKEYGVVWFGELEDPTMAIRCD